MEVGMENVTTTSFVTANTHGEFHHGTLVGMVTGVAALVAVLMLCIVVLYKTRRSKLRKSISKEKLVCDNEAFIDDETPVIKVHYKITEQKVPQSNNNHCKSVATPGGGKKQKY